MMKKSIANALTVAVVAIAWITATPADADLIGHWKLDDGLGATTAVDSSGNGYDLSQHNAEGSWTNGQVGGAYNLPRFTADATDSGVLNLAGGSIVTLSAWVTAYDSSTWGGIAGFDGTGTSGDIYSLKVNDDDTITWLVNGVAATTTIKLTDYTEGEWIHLVGVYEEGNGSILYVNGENAASATPTGAIVDRTTPGLFRIGTYYNSDSFEYMGSIDDVRVYDSVMTPAEIIEETFPDGLIGHWTFDESAGTTAADSSSHANTATQAGTVGSWVSGKYDNAYRLGGLSSRFELAYSGHLQVTGAVTVAAWVKPLTASSYGLIAGIDTTGGTANDMYSLKTDGGDKPRWAVVSGGGGDSVEFDATDTLANFSAARADGWVHLAGVFDPGVGAYLYVNGVLNASDVTSVPTSIQLKATDFQMGHNAADSGSYPLNAAVDDVRIYNRALSAKEVYDVAFVSGTVIMIL